ncbi:hypothetical protein FO519_003404 [Halicephalobus sp. NKZ332]|nr:hypothetical protein FO519_003404 [Halicephalobus sp. NKZ332]
MGSCFSSSDDEEKCRRRNRASLEERQGLFQDRKRTTSTMGVGLGVAMMMQQAGALVGAYPPVDIDRIEAEVRKAKAEGRTVTLINGCLYFDYQIVAQIPPHVDLAV